MSFWREESRRKSPILSPKTPEKTSRHRLSAQDEHAADMALREFERSKSIQNYEHALGMIFNTKQKLKHLPAYSAVLPRHDRRKFEKNVALISQWNRNRSSDHAHTRDAFNSLPTRSIDPRPTSPTSMLSSRSYISKASSRSGFSFRRRLPSGQRRVVIKRSKIGSFGFNVRGGGEFNLKLYVSWVDRGSNAEKAGLLIGDVIISVNGQDVSDMTHKQAAEIIRNSHKVKLVVESTGKVPSHVQQGEAITWKKVPRGKEDRDFRRIEMDLTANGLGMSIRGGSDQGTGVFVSYLEHDGLAARSGLRVGDQIFDINGTDTQNLAHSEIVTLLSTQKKIFMTVKTLPQVPSKIRVVNNTMWTDSHSVALSQSPSRGNSKTRRKSNEKKKDEPFLEATSLPSSPSAFPRRTQLGNGLRSIPQQAVQSFSGLGQDMVRQHLTLVPDELDRERVALAVASYRSATITYEHLAETIGTVLAPPGSQLSKKQRPLLDAIRGILSPGDLQDFETTLKTFRQVKTRKQSLSGFHSQESVIDSDLPDDLPQDDDLDANLDFFTQTIEEAQALIGDEVGATVIVQNDLELPSGFTLQHVGHRTLHKFSIDTTSARLGLTIEGGCDTRRPEQGIRINDYRKNGAVGIDGRLKVGDEILQINEISLANLTHDEVIDIVVRAIESPDTLIFFLVAREDHITT